MNKRTLTEEEKSLMIPTFKNVMENVVKMVPQMLHVQTRMIPGLEHIKLDDCKALVREQLKSAQINKKAVRLTLARKSAGVAEKVVDSRNFRKVVVEGHPRPMSKAKGAAILAQMLFPRFRTPEQFNKAFAGKIRIYPGFAAWEDEVPQKEVKEKRWLLDEAFIKTGHKGRRIVFSSQWGTKEFEQIAKMARKQNLVATFA